MNPTPFTNNTMREVFVRLCNIVGTHTNSTASVDSTVDTRTLTEFGEVVVTSLKDRLRRRSDPLIVDVGVTIKVFRSRLSSDNLTRTDDLATLICEDIDDHSFPIRNHVDATDDVVGHLCLFEAVPEQKSIGTPFDPRPDLIEINCKGFACEV